MQTSTPHFNSMPTSAPWYKHKWPWLLMLGPGVVVVGGAFTIWLAVKTPDALVVDDYYKQGKAINQDLKRDRVAAARGLELGMRYAPAAGKLAGQLKAKNGPVTERVRIQLIHSTQPGKDMHMVVQPDANGAFTLDLPMLETARWQVMVESMDRQWRLNGEWAWPREREILVKSDVQALDQHPAGE
ncbi:hypothetical protein EDC30_101374 [Paucimonas lemoignei]|uniref:Cytochrome oxidase assembly protein n=1 Tax=Paucimonas lemoignei TaxID=29443 RepID=A0A4R3I1G6_PAULE|nr:FixH family protein [Paucimonas lemoignei]TCS39418.1 hypothetical protein EDC30_101374 [Paucimonas lemoignei]